MCWSGRPGTLIKGHTDTGQQTPQHSRCANKAQGLTFLKPSSMAEAGRSPAAAPAASAAAPSSSWRRAVLLVSASPAAHRQRENQTQFHDSKNDIRRRDSQRGSQHRTSAAAAAAAPDRRQAPGWAGRRCCRAEAGRAARRDEGALNLLRHDRGEQPLPLRSIRLPKRRCCVAPAETCDRGLELSH